MLAHLSTDGDEAPDLTQIDLQLVLAERRIGELVAVKSEPSIPDSTVRAFLIPPDVDTSTVAVEWVRTDERNVRWVASNDTATALTRRPEFKLFDVNPNHTHRGFRFSFNVRNTGSRDDVFVIELGPQNIEREHRDILSVEVPAGGTASQAKFIEPAPDKEFILVMRVGSSESTLAV